MSNLMDDLVNAAKASKQKEVKDMARTPEREMFLKIQAKDGSDSGIVLISAITGITGPDSDYDLDLHFVGGHRFIYFDSEEDAVKKRSEIIEKIKDYHNGTP